MSVSTKELFTAFFKGLAFAKGLNFGDKNRGMAEDRWITIHPWGMSQGEADAGEGKGYYRRIEINDETGEIEKGLGAGTNIKDLSKTLKAKRKGEEGEKEPEAKKTEEKTSLKDKIKKIVSIPFVKSKFDHTWHEFSPERVQSVLSKLDETGEATEEALKTVEENIKDGKAAILHDTLNNIETYTQDKQGYLRSLKATEKIYKNAVDFFKKAQEKLSESVNEKDKLKELATHVKEYFGKRFKKDAKDEDVQRTIKLNQEKGTLGRLSDTVGMKDDYFRIKDRANGLIDVVSKAVDEKFNPAKDKRYQLKRFKNDISGLTSMIKNYANANNLAMDSADFAEIQTLLNELNNGNNGLDLFINKVNIER